LQVSINFTKDENMNPECLSVNNVFHITILSLFSYRQGLKLNIIVKRK